MKDENAKNIAENILLNIFGRIGGKHFLGLIEKDDRIEMIEEWAEIIKSCVEEWQKTGDL